MQQLDHVDKWIPLEQGQCLEFEKTTKRRVRLHVNAPGPVILFLSRPGEKPVFLARVEGLDTIVFSIEGAFAVCPDEFCHVYTAEREKISATGLGEKFTKLMEPKPRNREFELMQFNMMKNVERRLAQQRNEYEAYIDNLKAEKAATDDSKSGKNPKAGSGKSGNKSAGDGGEDKEGAAGAGESGDSGGSVPDEGSKSAKAKAAG